ncbi:MAG: VWA domain-containing protein [Vicinamibacterales bacterium]
MTFQRLAACGLLLGTTLVAAQEPQPEPLPRFRGGATLVRVDAYITRDGVPVTDLARDDIEILEDDVPQAIESFELVAPRGPETGPFRVEPNTVAESRQMATDPDSRVFVLFMDTSHVHIAGSYRAQNPVTRLLDRVIGAEDLVGVMTPEMSARNLTLARRMETVEGILRDNWFWGERDKVTSADPRENEIRGCYPDAGPTEGIADEMIDRRRETRTLEALEDLIEHLEDLREERKFVVVLSEGWALFRRNERLGRVIRYPDGTSSSPQGPGTVGVGPDGKLTMSELADKASLTGCERERSLLAFADNEITFRQLLQRANRANVSFYPVDPRGLTPFDDDVGPRRPLSPSEDRARLGARQGSLRTLAEQTDGFAVVDTNNIDAALDRMVADTGAYYLLGYYSTNTKLDGRFRRITVRTKRPGLDVRARPGYLAPTEAEAASARVDRLMNGAPPGHSTIPPEMRRALDSLATARGTLPLRAQAAGGNGFVWIAAELDPETMRQPDWQAGGQARLTIEHAEGGSGPLVVDATLEPGQRTLSLVRPERDLLAPGRYVIRVEFRPVDSSLPLQTTVDAVVPAADARLASAGIAFRRGPTTGLDYLPTADARFRRTERVRLEVPRISPGGTVAARLLNVEGQEIPVPVRLAEKLDESLQLRSVVADLTLAPLAQGEYVIEVSVADGSRRDVATYGFRIVP